MTPVIVSAGIQEDTAAGVVTLACGELCVLLQPGQAEQLAGLLLKTAIQAREGEVQYALRPEERLRLQPAKGNA